MNRIRINQMLGVLLFPYLDPELQKKDYLWERYDAYNSYLQLSGNSITDIDEKQKRNRKFQTATDELIDYLASKSRTEIKSYDDLLMLCELYYPIHKNSRREITEVYMDGLARIAESLITYRDGIPAIRTWNNMDQDTANDIFYSRHAFEKVQIWNMLNCFMTPDILIAAFADLCGWNETVLYEQRPYISLADKLLAQTLQKGIAENHLHFNAGMDYGTVWINAVNLFRCCRPGEYEADKDWPSCFMAAVFRLSAALYFSSGHGQERETKFMPWAASSRLGGIRKILEDLLSGNTDTVILKNTAEELRISMEKYTDSYRADYLLDNIYHPYIELKTSSEFILIFHCYRYAKHSKDTDFARIFLQYLRIKNHFFRNKQQGSLIPGLRHFQRYFDAAKSAEFQAAGRSGLGMDVFRSQSKMACLKKLEIRVAPDIDMSKLKGVDSGLDAEFVEKSLCSQLEYIFSTYRKYIFECIVGVTETEHLISQEEKRSLEGRFSCCDLTEKVCRENPEKLKELTVPTMGIVYHLIKMENLDNLSGYYCAKVIDQKRINGSGHRFFWREAMGSITRIIETIRSKIPYIHEYIVGIDAASDENAMEPWMFVPAYNRMRAKNHVVPVMREEKSGKYQYHMIQNAGFTYHVGEDYRHIVSGLRHIDEVIEGFHYKPGDRLGHAIALGTDISRWVEANEIVALPAAEYLDNLLWIWGKCTNDHVRVPVQMEVLEKMILENAENIYGNIDGITVIMLYQAYKGKFSDNHQRILKKLNEEQDQDLDESCYGYCRYDTGDCEKYFGKWSRDKLIYTNYCPVFEERGNRVQQVPITKREVQTYEILQKYLLQKVERMGIYVETNPTSNVTIGDFNDLFMHPIFKMSTLAFAETKGHHVMVTVNSDDPAVFNTNVENELAYIYYAMESRGYAKEDVIGWIDKVRQNGLDASFIQKVKSAEVQLKEIDCILDQLRRYRIMSERQER